MGVSHTLSIIRQQFWIPQGRTQVQKIIKKCPQCVKHGGGPYVLPPTPDLPPERVTFNPPFTYTGMDYFGPMYVTTEQGKEKRWICLYTCLVVRAIHMEVVKNLTADECLLSLRRFIATRGVPTLIVSDNALQFRLTSEVLSNPYCNENNIKWKFIPQLAPWHGGVYERLVAVVKHCLKRTLQKHLLGDNQLLTVIKEVESVCNTRPLTYVNSEQEHILKPSDFLSLGKCIAIEPSLNQTLPEGTSVKQNLIEGWKRGHRIMSEFKSMFVGQYLASLRERYRHSHKQPRVKSDKVPRVGDVVQIKGDTKNRENWKVGKISSLIEGPDGESRVAKVKIGDAEFTRSIGHLYPLEAEITGSEDTKAQMLLKIGNAPNAETINDKEFPIAQTHEVDPPHENEKQNHLSDPAEEVHISSEANPEAAPNVTCLRENESEMARPNDVPEMMNVDSYEDSQVVQEVNLSGNNSDDEASVQDNPERRQKRAAAIRAREKIAEWTRLLFTLLH